ncbi:unnamed protein product [Urochloa humidicola]
MEFVGASLRRLLSSLAARFTKAGASAAMRNLLHGAERIQAAGIIHHDIKSDNVLVAPGVGGNGTATAVKICDLG